MANVTVHARFTHLGRPAEGKVVFTDRHHNISSSDGTIEIPFSVTGYLDQSGTMWVDVPLGEPAVARTYTVSIEVTGFRMSFKSTVLPTASVVELSSLMPAPEPPVLPEAYVSSLMGKHGHISRAELLDGLFDVGSDGVSFHEQVFRTNLSTDPKIQRPGDSDANRAPVTSWEFSSSNENWSGQGSSPTWSNGVIQWSSTSGGQTALVVSPSQEWDDLSVGDEIEVEARLRVVGENQADLLFTEVDNEDFSLDHTTNVSFTPGEWQTIVRKFIIPSSYTPGTDFRVRLGVRLPGDDVQLDWCRVTKVVADHIHPVEWPGTVTLTEQGAQILSNPGHPTVDAPDGTPWSVLLDDGTVISGVLGSPDPAWPAQGILRQVMVGEGEYFDGDFHGDLSYRWTGVPWASTSQEYRPELNFAAGKSAYEQWLAQGHTGTVEDFLAYLRGPSGPEGPQGVPGPQGPPGAQGRIGPAGPVGRSFGIDYVVASTPPEVAPDRSVAVTTDDQHLWTKVAGEWIDLGSYKGDPGDTEMPTKADLGLELVDNTADLDKPISTLTQAALTSLGNKDTQLQSMIDNLSTTVDQNGNHVGTLESRIVTVESVNNTQDSHLATLDTTTAATDAAISVFPGQISALQGRADIASPTEISSNANMNSYTTPGWWICSTIAKASLVSNGPAGLAVPFVMEIIPWGTGLGSVLQRITPLQATSSGELMTRVLSSGSWSPWRVYGADTGWVDVTILPGFAARAPEYRPQVRRIDSLVHFRGHFSEQGIIQTSSLTIARIPEGFRPPIETRWMAFRTGFAADPYGGWFSPNGDVVIQTNALGAMSNHWAIVCPPWPIN